MNNNPIKYIDPSGHDPITFLLIIAAVALLTTSCTPTPPPSSVMDSAVGMLVIDPSKTDKGYPSIGTYLGNGQIYTHNHFPVNPEASPKVILFDAEGNVIAEYPGGDLTRTTSGDNGSSIITLPGNLPLEAATLTTDIPLKNGMQVESAAFTDPIKPWEGMYLESGTITDEDYFYTNQTLPEGNSGTGGWVYYKGNWYLAGNLMGGPGEDGNSPRFYHGR